MLLTAYWGEVDEVDVFSFGEFEVADDEFDEEGVALPLF